MCSTGVLIGAGAEYLTGLGLRVLCDSGTRCLWLFRMMAVSVCTGYCLGLPVPFKTKPCLCLLLFLELIVEASLLDGEC